MKIVGENRAARRARGFSVVVGRMGAAMTLALRRFALRWLRKLVDVADDRLHAAEVTLRNDLSAGETSRTDNAQLGESVRDNRSPGVLSQRSPAGGTLRNDLSDLSARQHPTLTVHSSEDLLHQRTDDQRPEAARPESETFLQWEARRSGIAPVPKKRYRLHRRRSTAADFDFQIIRKREEFVQ